jgi:hypothetical protein
VQQTSRYYVLTTSFGVSPAEVDGRHTAMVQSLRERLPNLGWSASWRALEGGSWDVLDALDLQPGEEPSVIEEVLREQGIRFELVRVEPSAWLRAPG